MAEREREGERWYGMYLGWCQQARDFRRCSNGGNKGVIPVRPQRTRHSSNTLPITVISKVIDNVSDTVTGSTQRDWLQLMALHVGTFNHV